MTHLRISTFLVALLLSTNVAFASPSDGGAGASSAASTAGGASHSVVGLLSGVGLAGAAAGASMAFRNTSTGHKMDVVTKAPEISASGALSGMMLLLGGALVIRGRREATA